MRRQARDLDTAVALQLAGCVSGSREAFAAVFNRVAAMCAPEPYIDFKLAALGQPTSLAAFSAAFIAARKGGWMWNLVGHAVEAHVLAAAAVAVAAKAAAQFGNSDARQLVVPQGYDSTIMGFLRPEEFSAGLLTGMRRLCRVDVGHTHGSGFLVGLQAVMTNFHVIEPLLDKATNRPQPGSAAALSCIFDFLGDGKEQRVMAAEEWLLWSSPAPAGRRRRNGENNVDLDCAIVRLCGAPGQARGWYSLKHAAAVPRGRQEGMFVLQHPAGMNQRIGLACNVECNDVEVRHKAPTAEGSSGGLCLDGSGRFVGLHRAALFKGRKLETNLATAALAIVAALPAGLQLDRGLDVPVWRLSRCRSPVLAREETCKRLLRMRGEKGKGLLVVQGRRHSGKSFTRRLIEEYLHPAAPWLVAYHASELPLRARDLAERILSDAGAAKTLLAKLPTPDHADTTDIAWIRDELFPVFRSALHEIADARNADLGRVLWLVVDLPHDAELPETSAREFLYTLLRQIVQARMLRVVLLGLRGALPAGDRLNDAEDDILPDPLRLPHSAIEHYIGCLFAEAGLTPGFGEIARLAELAWEVARESGDTALPSLAGFLKGPLQAALAKVGVKHEPP